MKLREMSDNQKRIMMAMLDARYASRTVAGLAGLTECDEAEVKSFLEAHPRVFCRVSGCQTNRDLWMIDRRCEGPNLLALRLVLFKELGEFPIEARTRPELPAVVDGDAPGAPGPECAAQEDGPENDVD